MRAVFITWHCTWQRNKAKIVTLVVNIFSNVRYKVYNNAEYIMTNLNACTPKMQFKSIFNVN